MWVVFCLFLSFFLTGSVLSSGGSGPYENAVSSDWADMVDGFQKSALESRLGIPLIYGIDAVHGNNSIYGATIYPHNVGLGASRLVLSFKLIRILKFLCGKMLMQSEMIRSYSVLHSLYRIRKGDRGGHFLILLEMMLK